MRKARTTDAKMRPEETRANSDASFLNWVAEDEDVLKERGDQKAAPSVAQATAYQLAYELGTTTDAFRESLERTEAGFAELNLGVAAYVQLNEDPTEGPWQEVLSFRKEGNAWKLMFECGPEGEPDRWSTTPLVSASREIRLRAAVKLEELYDALVKEAARQLALVREGVECVEAFNERRLRKVAP